MTPTKSYFESRADVIAEHWREFLGEFGAYLLIGFFLIVAGFTTENIGFRVGAIFVGECAIVTGVLVLLWRCLFSRLDR